MQINPIIFVVVMSLFLFSKILCSVSGVVKRQKEVLTKVTDSATDFGWYTYLDKR